MKIPLMSVALAAIFALPSALFSQEAKSLPQTRDVKGTIFNDPNFNGKLDNTEKGGQASTIWLYRMNPDGSVRRIRKFRTDPVGNYITRNVPFGRYFMAVRYGSGKFAVRTRPFVLGPKSGTRTQNVPLITRQTIRRYPAYTIAPNPDNLDQNAPISPAAP